MELQTINCCGVVEIDGLSNYTDAKEAMKAFASVYSYDIEPPRPFILFSGLASSAYAKRFASFIRHNGLGQVVGSPIKLNRNSGNRIRVYMWTINNAAVKAWGKKHCPEEMAEREERQYHGW